MVELLKKLAIAGVGTVLLGGFSFAQVGNDHTGYESENNATIERDSDQHITTSNYVELDNTVDGMGMTGNNEANMNTGDGYVESGDVSADVSADNSANVSRVSVFSSEMEGEDLSVANSTTGAESVNNAWIQANNDLRVYSKNTAYVNNDIELHGSTGCNESGMNTGDGYVSSGDVSLSVSLSNTLNNSEVAAH